MVQVMSAPDTVVPLEFFNLSGEFFNLVWNVSGVPGVRFGTGLGVEYRTIQEDCWERGVVVENSFTRNVLCKQAGRRAISSSETSRKAP